MLDKQLEKDAREIHAQLIHCIKNKDHILKSVSRYHTWEVNHVFTIHHALQVQLRVLPDRIINKSKHEQLMDEINSFDIANKLRKVVSLIYTYILCIYRYISTM